jgi:tripartite-type tricarboxylate transporter receptor subunit TctC
MRIARTLSTLVFALAASAAQAQSFPAKQVNLMVPYPAGGLSDTIARMVNNPLSKQLGQPVLIENLGGASGAIGAQKVLSAPSDGYYLFQGSPNELILSPLANAAVKFRSEDFRLVQMIGVANMAVFVRKDLKANSFDELVELAKSSKDKPLTYGSVGVGSFYHLLGEHLSKLSGAPMTHVPYKGFADLVPNLVSGEIDFAMIPYSKSFAALADQGRIRILSTLSPTRLEAARQVPSVSEGKTYKDFNFNIWTGYFVKKDTPDAIVQAYHKALTEVLGDTGVRNGLIAQSTDPAKPLSLAEAARTYQAGIEQFRAIAKSINLQPQ